MASPSRTKYYSPLKVENDQKNVLIAELKAENFELRTKERDYSSLHAKLLDIEHRYSLLRDEKLLALRDSKSKEELGANSIAHHRAEIEILRVDLDRRTGDSRELVSEANVFKHMLDEKNVEMAKLKSQVAEEMEYNQSVRIENAQLERELDLAQEGKRSTGISLESAQLEGRRLGDLRAEDSMVMKDKNLEIARLDRKQLEFQEEIALLNKEKREVGETTEVTREGRRANNMEVERLVQINDHYQGNRKDKDQQILGLEADLLRLSRRNGDNEYLILAKDKQLNEGRDALRYAEDIGRTSKTELSRILQEKEALELLAAQNKQDAALNHKLRNEEMERNQYLAHEKKDLERKIIDTELHSYTTKKELEKAAVGSENLIEHKYALNDELQALKGHSNVLSTHHSQLSKEIDRFVEIDEQMRNKLHVKPRVENLLKVQDLELEKSMNRMRNSHSPLPRSPYRSPYADKKYQITSCIYQQTDKH